MQIKKEMAKSSRSITNYGTNLNDQDDINIIDVNNIPLSVQELHTTSLSKRRKKHKT